MSAIQIVPSERVENYILLIRGQKVILDVDLAELYGVPTKRLNEQIKRNQDRFPEDFMFRLTNDEKQRVIAIKRLMDPPPSSKKRTIGFHPWEDEENGK